MKISLEFDTAKHWLEWKAFWSRNPDLPIVLLLAFIFAAHMLQIAFPNDGSMIFDEAHYVPASVATMNGVAANAEHPPLSKIIAAWGIMLLGNNWFGWRFPQVLMQIGTLYLLYLVARRLIGDPWALGATALLGLDMVFFIHGGALLIDMAPFFLAFLAFELYFRKRYNVSAVSMGLAILAREMSVFYFGTLAVYHLVTNRHRLRSAMRIGLRYTFIALVVFGGLLWYYDETFQPYSASSVTNFVNQNIIIQDGTPVTTILSTSQVTSKELMLNPFAHVLFIMRYHGWTGEGGITISEAYRAYQYAWNWILPIHISPDRHVTFDPLDAPTYFRVDVDVSGPEGTAHYVPVWYQAVPNPFLWYGLWLGVVGLALCVWRREELGAVTFITSSFLLNYLPWVAISLTARRIGFNYYMIYALPFAALAIALFWKKMPGYGKVGLAMQVLLSLVYFISVFPVRPMP